MEVRGRNPFIENSPSNSSTPLGTMAFHNFTIPRTNRVYGQVLLEPCPEDSYDFSLIQSKLRECRLDTREEHANTWLWKDVRLVHNDMFMEEFSEKRSEMHRKGRHGREMEEYFCFLVASYRAASEIYQFGLRIGTQGQCSLGKPSDGVYLFKHVDVALKHTTVNTYSGKTLIVFKVLFGKVKTVTPSLDWNRPADPTVGFDCHMAKEAYSYCHHLSQQVLGSSVFLFDYNENQELNNRPRQCLPYAVISFAPANASISPTIISPHVSHTKPSDGHMHAGPFEHGKDCTMAKRTGEEENVIVNYKHFVTHGSRNMEYQSQTPKEEDIEAHANSFEYNNRTSYICTQPYIPHYHTSYYFNPSLPYYDNSIKWQSHLDPPAFLSDISSLSTSVCGGNADTLAETPDISNIVYSSRLVKDPRLYRQDANIQQKSPEEVRSSSVPESVKQGFQAQTQNQREKNESTSSSREITLELEHKKIKDHKPSLDGPSKSNPIAQSETENLPSAELLNIKFQKYYPYFKMTEEERYRKVWSKANATQEQKQLLIDRINFYHRFYQQYKNGLLFQNDTKTKNTFSLSQNNDVCRATLQHSTLMTPENNCEVNQLHIRHSVSDNAPNLTPMTISVDTEKANVCTLNTDNDSLSQNTVQENECSFHPFIESENGAVKEKERIAEMRVPVQSNPSEKSKTSEGTQNSEQSFFPLMQDKINNPVVHESEIAPSPESACKPTYDNTIEDYPENEQQINTMEVANFVDISATDVAEFTDCSYLAYAMEPGQDSENSTEEQDSEALAHSKTGFNSSICIEVKREETEKYNAIYKALYKRIELDQLLPNSNSKKKTPFSGKPYPKLTCLDKTPDISLVKEPMSKQEEDDLQLIFNQTFPERLTLSDRFSKLRCLSWRLEAMVYVNSLNNSYSDHLSGNSKCNPECGDGGKVHNNVEMIKLMAQSYNENMPIEYCKKSFRQKRSCRKSSSAPRKGHSSKLSSKTKQIRKGCLLKAMRNHKPKVTVHMSQTGRTSFHDSDSSNGCPPSKTNTVVDSLSSMRINSPAAYESLPSSQSHGKLLNERSIQKDKATNIITAVTSGVDTENKTIHVELSRTKGRYVNSARRSMEIVCCDVSEISNENDISISEEDIHLVGKDKVIVVEMERDIVANNNKKNKQGTSSPVTWSTSNESRREHKEEALLQKNLSRKDNIKELSTDYHSGAYEDINMPVHTVSNDPSAIISGNMIIGCTTEARRAMTPESHTVMNNETQLEARNLSKSAVDNTSSELVSSSQRQASLWDTKSNGTLDPTIETTSEFHKNTIRNAQEHLNVIKKNLLSSWQEQDTSSLPNSYNTQIITKLKDYLTKFDIRVRKDDTVSNLKTKAWINLDSTAHKLQLPGTRHYSRQGLADTNHINSETECVQVTPTKHKQSSGDIEAHNAIISKRRRISNVERVSPDSTCTETVRNEPYSQVNKSTQPHQVDFGKHNTNYWLQSYGNKQPENQTIYPQVLAYVSESNGHHGNESTQHPCQKIQSNQLATYERIHTAIGFKYSVTDVSNILKLADHSVSLTELWPLQSKCDRMLNFFISNFEQDQNVSFHKSFVSRSLILEKHLDHPPVTVKLNFEAINSFLELQMIYEACQFLQNKISFLKRRPTFRSLLWYDPSLYGELFKGPVWFQQQSSMFSTLQQCLTSDDCRALREHYCTVSALHQQLQDAPDTSYYMYLKTKRERLEIEAAFRNPSDVKNFFLSVPITTMINLGDSLEILKKTNDIVMRFIETPVEQLPGTFDVGKAEHLSILCRYLQEKILMLNFNKNSTNISWFGMEHILYDASKVLVWTEAQTVMPNELTVKHANRLNSSLVCGMTGACVNKTDQSPQPMDIVNIMPPEQLYVTRVPSTRLSTESNQSTLNSQLDNGTKEIHQPLTGRATHTSPGSIFSDGVTPLIQPNLVAQPRIPPFYSDFTQRSDALPWKIPVNPSWDRNPPNSIQSTSHSEIRDLPLSKWMPVSHTKQTMTSFTELQNRHADRQQHLSQPLIVKPIPIQRSKAQKMVSSTQHLEFLNEQANKFTKHMLPPLIFPSFPPNAPSVVPPLSPQPFPSTSQPFTLHNNPTQISYPVYVINEQTYSTTGSSY